MLEQSVFPVTVATMPKARKTKTVRMRNELVDFTETEVDRFVTDKDSLWAAMRLAWDKLPDAKRRKLLVQTRVVQLAG